MGKIHTSFYATATSTAWLILVMCGCACSVPVHAATWWFNPTTLTTTTSGTAYLWSTLPNWNSLADGSGTTPAAVPGTGTGVGDDVVFNVSGSNSLSGTYALGAARSVGSLTVNTSGASTITRNSGTAGGTYDLAVGSGGITLGPTAGSVYFSFHTAPLTSQRVLVRASGSSLPITNNSSSLLSFQQYVDTTVSSGTATVTVAANGVGGVSFLNGINNGSTGQVALVINSAGSGTTSLLGSSTSTYSGGTTLTSGVLYPIRNALGTGPLVINGGSYVCDAQQIVSSVTLTSGTVFANSNFALGTGPVTVSGGKFISDGNARTSFNPFTLAGDLVLGGTFNLTISNTNQNQFNLGGATRTIAVTDATLSIQANVINGGIVKTGTGGLSLSGSNTYSGTTSVAQGTLTIASTAALPGWDTAGRYAVQAGARLGVGDGVSGADIGTILGTGNLSAGSTIAITTSTVSTTLSAAVNGIGLVKSGSSTLTLTGSNTPTATTVSGGVLQVGDGGTTGAISGDVAFTGSSASLAFNRSDDIVFSGTISGVGNLVKSGAGTLVLTAANTLTGSTTVQGGRLQLADGTALSLSKVVPLVGGTLSLTPFLQATVGGLAPNAGGLTDVGSGMVTVAAGLSAADMVTAIITGLGDGSWSGTSGITSSVAATSGGDRTVGWLDNGDGTVTVAFAAAGDTNLDWQVDIIDAANFLAGGKFDTGSPATWNEGDFTYDGMVDILDAASFLSNGLFDAGSYNPPPGQAGEIAAVPEPAIPFGLLVTATAVVDLLRRRQARSIMRSAARLFLVCGFGCMLPSPAAHAATWWFNPATLSTTASGTAYLWSTLPNWNSLAAGSGTAPAAVPGASDDVVFNVTGSNSLSGTYALAAARSVNSMTVNTSGASSMTRNSGTAGGTYNLSIGSGGITLGPSAGSLYFSFNTAPLAAQRVAVRASGASLPITNNSSSLLSFEQYVDNALASGTSTITVSANGAGGVTFLNGINNGATSTTAVVINSAGSGTTTIIGNSASTYTGGTTLTAGILTPLRYALGTGSLVVNGGAYVCDTQQQVSSVTLTSGTIFANGNLALGTAPVTVSGGQIISNGNGRVLDNAFTLAGDLTLGGTFNLTISNSNQFGLGGGTRTISVTDATLAIQGNVINGGIVKTGTGVLSLSGTNTYSGTTTVAQGTLSIASTAALPGWNTSGRYTVQSGARLGVGDGVSGADIGTILGTGNLSAGSTIAITTSTVGITLPAGVNGIGLVKSGANTLTLTGSNTPTSTTINGGALQVGAGGAIGSLSGDVAVTASGTLAFNRSDDIVFGGTISGAGNLVKNAANRLTLSANSTYTGSTDVLGGTLIVNGNNSAATGAVNIAGGILGGTGMLGGALVAGTAGTIAPGASIGVLTGTQTVSFTNGSIFAYELNTASVTSDLLRVGSDLSLAGTVTLALSDLSTSTAVAGGTVLSLINYAGNWNGGLFTYNSATLLDGDTFTLGANQWRINYASSVQGGNVTTPSGSNYVNLIVVPEPTVWVSGGLVLLVLAARRRSP